MIAYKNLLRAIENIGIAVVYGIRYYGTGRITHDNYVQFIRHDALGFEYIDQSKNFVPQVRQVTTTINNPSLIQYRKSGFNFQFFSRDLRGWGFHGGPR